MAALQIQSSQLLQEDGCFQLRRVTTHDGEELLLKLAVSDDRGHEDKLLEREFELLRAIGADHALTALRVARLGDKLAAISGSFDGTPLGGSALAPWELPAVIGELCAILGAVHRRGVMLLGFGPGSFLRTARGPRVVLAQALFAQAEGAAAREVDPSWFESPCLAYGAPELFGDAALAPDLRADLYALGGVLYHLVAGRPPFDTGDPTELVQCHLTRAPRPLGELAPAVSRELTDAVMRLLAKDPRERYASVDAFELAIAGYLDAGPPHAPEPSRQPMPELSAKLHGHGLLVDTLGAKIRTDRVRPYVVFLEGDPGIGKTTVLREVQRAESHACCCWGEFDRDGAAGPLRGWTGALVGLANLVLTSRTDELERWRGRIQEGIGDWAPLIGALALEWQAILGCSGSVSLDPSDASLNHLALAIHRLLACFADEESPVVLILDDLQWADASSLRILELVLTAPEPLNLLVLAGVREGDDDGEGCGALHALRDQLDAARVDSERIAVPAWDRCDVMAFVADSLGGNVERAVDLADVLVAKTHGNPFAVRELLRSLVLQHVLYFEVAGDAWRWSRQAVRRLPVSANVVALLAHRISLLPDDVKDALRTCACLGHEFSYADFVVASQPRSADAALRRAVAEGLLVERAAGRLALRGDRRSRTPRPTETTYAFVHDRVLNAARSLLSADASAAIHLRIGDGLLAHLGERSDDNAIFRVASHFNLAASLIEDGATRYARAALDLEAGRLAKQRGAFSQALDFLQAGFGFLCAPQAEVAALAWRDQLDLTLALHEEMAEVALLNGRLALMTRLCDAILAHVDSPLQKVLAYELRIRGLKAEKRFSAAVDVALEILAELGMEFPARPTMAHVALRFVITKQRVFSGPVARLADLPPLRDARRKAAARILQSVYSAAYIGRPRLFPLLVFHHVNDSLKHGNEDYSGVTYAAFGVVLSATGRFEQGAQLATIGLGLLERAAGDRLKARAVMAYYAFIFPWQHHIRETLPHYREGVEAGLAHGDFEVASYLMSFESLARLHAGDPLPDLQPELERHADKIRSLGQERSILLQSLVCQLGHGLRHGAESGGPLVGRFYDEHACLPRCLEPLDESLVFHHYLAKMMLGLFLGDHASALEAAVRGRGYVRNGGFANYLTAVFLTYESLILLIEASRQPGRGVPRRVKRNLELLATWSGSAPMNFLHKVHLVEAERCRVLGKRDLAAEHFEQAIELAQAHGFTHEAGLAQERAAAFYFDRGMARLGREYLRDCYRSYGRWGADAVVRRVELQHAPQFAMLAGRTGNQVKRAVTRFSETLDYRTLLKSSQAISGEILLPRLLERLLQNILEHTGAQRGFLILEKRGELRVEAESSADSGRVEILGHEAVETSERLCRAIVHYSARMTTPVVLGDATRDGLFTEDPYVRRHRPRSMLCTPILYQGKLIGLIYLENNLVSHVFTEARLEVVSLMAGQAAISISNARLHALELEAQQAKINPHFLFNALSSIADVAMSDGSKAESAIVKLAGLYRYILTNSTGELVGLEQELEIVRNYLTLEKLRFGAKLDYAVTLDGDASVVRLPGLLIQPLVENSIRHGVAPKLAPGTVQVHAAVRADRCSITVQDDGDGGKHATGGTGFGLRSVQERLALTYGQQFSFAISRAGGYRVEVEIPIHRDAP